MLFLMSFVYKTLRLALVIAILTVVGQIPIRGISLENRYHSAVNSHIFQKTYWTLARPVTWTSEKVVKLFEHPENLSNKTR